MGLVKKILNKFNGLHHSQDYLCLAKESFSDPLHVYIVNNRHIIKDITNEHLFVGYSPLVFALPGADYPASLQLIFSQSSLQPNESYSKKDALASLELKQVKEQVTGNKSICYYEGIHGTHRFLSSFQQFVNSLYNRWYNKRPGNVFLHDNLYKQVQIAYAVPRVISLITISNNDLFNLFPTDLHGQVDDEHYIISLRTGGKACEQVGTAGKLLLSQVHSNAYKTVYGLGKNHMQELKPKEHFPFGESLSLAFKWPLPEQAVSCKELRLLDSFTHGIHKIMLFKIISQQQIQPQADTLAHIHNAYASWRFKNGLPGNYLLR
jgi:hypothetical protein